MKSKTRKELVGQITLFDFIVNGPTPADEQKELPHTSISTNLLKYCNSKTEEPKKPKTQVSPMAKFIKEYNGVTFEECYSVTGDDFKSFCRRLKNALKKEGSLLGFEDVIGCKPNHYDTSGYLKKGDKYVYFSLSVERYDKPTLFVSNSKPVHEVLYRTAESEKDYRGGHNNYCTLDKFVECANNLIK